MEKIAVVGHGGMGAQRMEKLAKTIAEAAGEVAIGGVSKGMDIATPEMGIAHGLEISPRMKFLSPFKGKAKIYLAEFYDINVEEEDGEEKDEKAAYEDALQNAIETSHGDSEVLSKNLQAIADQFPDFETSVSGALKEFRKIKIEIVNHLKEKKAKLLDLKDRVQAEELLSDGDKIMICVPIDGAINAANVMGSLGVYENMSENLIKGIEALVAGDIKVKYHLAEAGVKYFKTMADGFNLPLNVFNGEIVRTILKFKEVDTKDDEACKNMVARFDYPLIMALISLVDCVEGYVVDEVTLEQSYRFNPKVKATRAEREKFSRRLAILITSERCHPEFFPVLEALDKAIDSGIFDLDS